MNKLILIIVAVVALSAGFFVSSWQSGGLGPEDEKRLELEQARKNYSPIQGNILSPARKIAVPALIKDDGRTLTIDDLSGDWHLLFFGYTHCPDVCPTTMGVLAQAKRTALKNNQTFPGVWFVSVDPDRDEVSMLADYVQYFDKDFRGATGDKDLIKALTLQMSVVYLKMPPEGDDENSYLVDHSSAVLLMNPEGKLAAFLNPPHDPVTILKDVETVMSLTAK